MPESPSHTQPGVALREARNAAGLTQMALAQLARCSVAYVQMSERGYQPQDPARALARQRIIEALTSAGCPPDNAVPGQ